MKPPKRRQERHGFSRTSMYQTWAQMKDRCWNPNNHAYKDYGGRGIAVCQRWLNSFSAFIQDMGPRPPGKTIERINNDGNYEPGNCRWASRLEQQQNTRRPNNRPAQEARLIAACQERQSQVGNGSFRLGYREVSRIVGNKDPYLARDLLADLITRQVLERVHNSRSNKARAYRLVQQELIPA